MKEKISIVRLLTALLLAGILIAVLGYVLHEVTAIKRLEEFRGTCNEVAEAIARYKLINGVLPATRDDLARYFVGGWALLEERPKGAVYEYRDGVFTAAYTDLHGKTHSFVFPELTQTPE